MSIVKIPKERKEQFTLELHPEIEYLSSSIGIPSFNVTAGVIGSAPLRRRPSDFIKELQPIQDPQFNGQDPAKEGSAFDEAKNSKSINLETAIAEARSAAATGVGANIDDLLREYMKEVNLSPNPAVNTKKIFITRFDPPFTHNDVSVEKSIIQNNLMPFYESKFTLCEMSYTNYHTLNFFSAPNGSGAPAAGSVGRIPDNSALIYQNFTSSPSKPRPYSPSGSFSFDFYINPRYTNETGRSFDAGTIMHLSSTFAISLVSGSAKDANGHASSFRLMLQLSHSADIPPSQINVNNLGTHPRDLVFLSSDNSLNRNKWSHCTVRWGTKSLNEGTGSFVIESTSSNFVVPSSSIMPPKHISNSALVVGNYFESKANEAQFFNKTTSNEGVSPILDFGPGFNVDPPVYTMRHPLNAEIHELKIFNKHLSEKEIKKLSSTSPRSFKNLLFYVPPFFTPTGAEREMLVTPFQAPLTSSTKPFNETYSFGVGGFVMNLENHIIDLVTKNRPRCLHLTASTINTTVTDISANQHVYSTGSIKKRNLTILPNDNGKFKPDYELISNLLDPGRSSTRRKNGGEDLSTISLENMVPGDKIFSGISSTTAADLRSVVLGKIPLADVTDSTSIANIIAGVTPESATGDPGPILTIAQRTRDRTSNEICFFDISNLYYGNQIQEKSLYITDPTLTGSDGKVSIKITDNGYGGMYRCDAEGPHPTWSNLGNTFYHEGIVIVKSPILTFFGKDCFEIKARGHQNTHISIFNVPLSEGLFNSSSNPNYQALSASSAAADIGKRFVYIDSLNIHDENFNVIAKSNFAQPIKKRIEDSLLIRFKMDF